MKGRVIKVLSDRFLVDRGETSVFVKSRKKIKRESQPLPGDIVNLDCADNEFVLSGIETRKSSMIRPPIANPDQIIITLAPLPEADLLTVDKMIINARIAGIDAVLCVNKTDIMPDGFFEDIAEQYDPVADNVIAVCAAKGETETLKRLLKGKFSCFAGQSAVGKTSLVNEICGLSRQVGKLSERTNRGKNTTTGVELIKTDEDTYVADTPGFGALDIAGVEPEHLSLYYDEYVKLSAGCKYHMCTHTNEPNCAVRDAVGSGLNEKRYERYLEIFNELKNKKSHRKSWRNTYESK